MKKKIFLLILMLFSLAGCNMLNPETQQKDFKIQQLQKDNENLKTENQELQQQNQKLALTGTKVLDRLSSLQKRYREISEENRDLSEQNQDLHQKLYQERIYKQKKFQEETQQDADDLQREAEKLFQNYEKLEGKPLLKENPQEKKEILKDSQGLYEDILKQEDSIKPEKPKMPQEKMDKGSQDASILERLTIKRQNLLQKKQWSLSDERTLEDFKKILQSDLSNQEKLKTIKEALEFEKSLESRK